jgi:hypothetical protein
MRLKMVEVDIEVIALLVLVHFVQSWSSFFFGFHARPYSLN